VGSKTNRISKQRDEIQKIMEENNEAELKWRKKFTEQRDNFISHKTHKIDFTTIKAREEEIKSPKFQKQSPEVQDMILD